MSSLSKINLPCIVGTMYTKRLVCMTTIVWISSRGHHRICFPFFFILLQVEIFFNKYLFSPHNGAIKVVLLIFAKSQEMNLHLNGHKIKIARDIGRNMLVGYYFQSELDFIFADDVNN